MVLGFFPFGVFKIKYFVGSSIHEKFIISESLSRAELSVMKLRLNLDSIKLDVNRTVELNTGGVSGKALINLCLYMSGLLKSGSDKIEALKMAADQSPKERYLIKIVVEEMHQGGKTMYEAMRDNHFTSDEGFLNAVKAGEESSTLAGVLRTYAITNKKVTKVLSGAMQDVIKPLGYLMFIPIALLMVKFMGEDVVLQMSSSMGVNVPVVAAYTLMLPSLFVNGLVFIFASLIGYIVWAISIEKAKGNQVSRHERLLSGDKIKGIFFDLFRKNKLTKGIVCSKQDLKDIMAVRGLLEGGLPFPLILDFMSKRKDMYGGHKEAWIKADEMFASGLSIEQSLSHRNASPMIKYYLMRIYNTNEPTETCDEAIEFFIDEITRMTDRFTFVMSIVGMLSAVIAVLILLLGLYLPLTMMSKEASLG